MDLGAVILTLMSSSSLLVQLFFSKRHLASCKQWTLLFLRGVRIDDQAVAEKLESTQKRLGTLSRLEIA